MKEPPVIQFVGDDFGRRSGFNGDRADNLPMLTKGDEVSSGEELSREDLRPTGDRAWKGGGETSGVFRSMTEPGPLGPARRTPVCVGGPDRKNGKERRPGFDRRDFMVL